VGWRLGQHFLTDPRLLDRIVDGLDPGPDDVVIEIGAGRGALTDRLAHRVSRVIAIEKDDALAEALGAGRGARGQTSAGSVTVVTGDALQLDWRELLAPEHDRPRSPLPAARFKLVGNIPYYITTPLIQKALSPPAPKVIVFLVQKEVADRLGAAPGSKVYGALSAGVQATARVERLFVVRAGAFRPPPKVDSAVVRLTPLPQPLVGPTDQHQWRRFLAGLFSRRRKQLGTNLRALTGREKEVVQAMLGELGLDPEARPETLSPAELVGL
jgi:16S rRNA (adenine1518-N6/adenine1519-N6)-dimethyltransferase